MQTKIALHKNNVPGHLQKYFKPHLCDICYVCHLVEVFREVKRVLRDDGVLFCNLGDSYASGKGTCYNPGGGENSLGKAKKEAGAHPLNRGNKSTLAQSGLKPKDLIGIPWRVALALQGDGWWLRAAMPWIKANCLPESVRDRVTRAHEDVFMLTKNKRYFYDLEATRIAHKRNWSTEKWAQQKEYGWKESSMGQEHGGDLTIAETYNPAGRNRRTSDTFNESLAIRIEDQRAYLAHLEYVRDNGGMLLSEDGDPVALLVNTASFAGSHFATFPTKLVEPLIACGSSEKGCCPKCLSPWERVVEKTVAVSKKCPKTDALYNAQGGNGEKRTGTIGMSGGGRINGTSTTLGWRPTCECSGLPAIGNQPSKPSRPKRKKGESKKKYRARRVDYRAALATWETGIQNWRQQWAELKPQYDAEPTVPCTILDPFSGAGTALLQADRMGRDAIGIDISGDYAEMARERIADDAPMFVDVEIIYGRNDL